MASFLFLSYLSGLYLLLVEFYKSNHDSSWCQITKGIFILYYICSLVTQTEKAMAPHSSTLAWKIPWMEEPNRLQSMGP